MNTTSDSPAARQAVLARRNKLLLGIGGLLLTCGLCGQLAKPSAENNENATATANAGHQATVVAAGATGAAVGRQTADARPTDTPRPTDTAQPTAGPTDESTATPKPAAQPPILTPRPLARPIATAAPVEQPAAVQPLMSRGSPQGSACPPELPVKGNQGSNGWIYHVPGSNNYNQTKPEECFATAADAEAAGYRAPKN